MPGAKAKGGVGCSCTLNWQCHRGGKETKENALTHRSTLPRQQETKHYFARWGKGNRNEDDEWRIILLLPRKAMLSNTKLSIKVDGRPTLGRKVFVCCAYPGLPYVRDLIMGGEKVAAPSSCRVMLSRNDLVAIVSLYNNNQKSDFHFRYADGRRGGVKTFWRSDRPVLAVTCPNSE